MEYPIFINQVEACKPMSKKLRHSKFRNTGILFELLARQITADIISGEEESSARDVLFKYFKEHTELGKEWHLYSCLINERTKNEPAAERFLQTVVEQRRKLNNKQLVLEKYNLIREIKTLYPIDDFLKSGIKNYRLYASIYKVFEDAASNDTKFDLKEVYQSKNCIVENIVDRPSGKVALEEDLLSFYEQQDDDIRLLSYKFLVEGVNQKYKDFDTHQKEILREYINNVSNTNSLGKFLCTKIDEVKAALIDAANAIHDSEVIKIKINEVIRQLDNVKPGSIVKDNQVMVVLLSYELLKEVKKQIRHEQKLQQS
jgi:hypothetical protein